MSESKRAASPIPPAPAGTASGLGLNERDIKRLLLEPSPQTRLEVAQQIAGGYAGQAFTDRESQIAEQIFRHLARDTEVKVRAALSEVLKDQAATPRDIALTFAQDAELSVALPMLSHSLSLSDYDLVSIVERHSAEPERLVAIARRPVVTERISEALVETRQADAVLALTVNANAQISEQSYHAIIATFQAQSTLMAQLARRAHLPVTIAERLISKVSDQLTSQWSDQYRLYENEVSAQTQLVRESATLQLLDEDGSDEAHAALVNQLLAGGKLTPSLILNALCRGNVLFFEMALARLANIPLHNAQLLIYDQGSLGFSRLYERAALPKELADATRLTLGAVKTLEGESELPGTPEFAGRAAGEILLRAKGAPDQALTYILSMIKRHSQMAA